MILQFFLLFFTFFLLFPEIFFLCFTLLFFIFNFTSNWSEIYYIKKKNSLIINKIILSKSILNIFNNILKYFLPLKISRLSISNLFIQCGNI